MAPESTSNTAMNYGSTQPYPETQSGIPTHLMESVPVSNFLSSVVEFVTIS